MLRRTPGSQGCRRLTSSWVGTGMRLESVKFMFHQLSSLRRVQAISTALMVSVASSGTFEARNVGSGPWFRHLTLLTFSLPSPPSLSQSPHRHSVRAVGDQVFLLLCRIASDGDHQHPSPLLFVCVEATPRTPDSPQSSRELVLCRAARSTFSHHGAARSVKGRSQKR